MAKHSWVLQKSKLFRYFKMHDSFYSLSLFCWDIASGWVIIIRCKITMSVLSWQWPVKLLKAIFCISFRSPFLNIVLCKHILSCDSGRFNNISPPNPPPPHIPLTFTAKTTSTSVWLWQTKPYVRESFVWRKMGIRRKTNTNTVADDAINESTARLNHEWLLEHFQFVGFSTVFGSLFALIKCSRNWSALVWRQFHSVRFSI